jgi:Flp pilus assembly protein TadG
MRALRRFARSDSGQSIVEAALFMPPLLLVLMATIDLGRLSQFDAKLAGSARAGAQYGAQNLVTADDLAGMEAAALNDVPDMVGVTPNASSYCTCADGTSTACSGSACPSNYRLLYVEVTTTATFRPLFNLFLGPPVPRTRTAILQVGQ